MPKIIKPAKGTFTTADITVDSSGRIIAASTGSADSTPIHPSNTIQGSGPASGNYTAASNVNVAQLYLRGGGGGGAGSSAGGPGPNSGGGSGGAGGFGLWAIPVTHPFSAPYSLGAGGNGSPGTGGAGGASNFTAPGPTVYAANGGNGGTGGPTPAPTKNGNAGTISPTTNQIADFGNNSDAQSMYPVDGSGSGGAGRNAAPGGSGGPGTGGSIAIYDNE